MDYSNDIKSLLTIKVLRLVRPNLIGPLALSCDTRDLPGDLWDKELKGDVTAVNGVELLSLGQFLRLPQGFGNMYLGETFSSYVCIQNESSTLVTNVSVKVELQTTSQKFTIADQRTMALMKTGDTIDIVLHHEVKEMGKHMLICTLSYSVPNSPTSTEPIVLERFFKFQVKKPLDVKTKLYNAESNTRAFEWRCTLKTKDTNPIALIFNSDEVFLEAQIQNITTGAICLEKVDLEPSPAFTCTSMNNFDETGILQRRKLNMTEMNLRPKWPNVMLDVESSHQFLYRLTPKMEFARTSTNIGKMDIVWRTTMGDRGRLQTSQLQRQPPLLNDLKLTVEAPEISAVDTAFDAKCKLINTTIDREMELQLDLDSETNGYCWLGITKCKLGTLSPTHSLDINLSVFPIRTGLINISGIKITDVRRGEKFSFNDMIQIFVMQTV